MVDVLFQTLSQRLRDLWKPTRAPRAARAFRCQCGRPVFFRNSQCLACGTPLGYLPGAGAVVPLEPAGEGGLWRVFGAGAAAPAWRRCANLEASACNWMVDAGDANPLCRACRLNRVIPDLSISRNVVAWTRIELAKRRLVSQLLAFGLPLKAKSEDEVHGLAFDFLAATPEAPRVMTGHAEGVITLNIEEADDAMRERVRNELHEPYRTLLGHLRHEVGHYYWDRLVRDTPWLGPFRALFGDERADYAEALQRNYREGPPPDWPQRHVSAYASSHPWEDWAETWAHYLHMVDTVDTALSFGLDADDVEVNTEPWRAEVLETPDADFLSFVNAWVELTALLNEMSRSMGQPDFYPFILSAPAVRKLHFVHRVVNGRPAPEAPGLSGSAGTAA